MAPAGSFESLQAALFAGANSVYFGIEQLNMRAHAANNFQISDLPEIVRLCEEKNCKTYLTLNTILYNHDIVLMKKIIDEVKKVGVTAIIASDIAAISYANEVGVEVHISTQANVSNIEAVKFFAKFADVIVLARELPLTHIKSICETIEKEHICGPKGNLVEIEIFAHGALCVAISGKCYMSLATQNSSANRGACLQNCRRSYRVIDEETGEELVLDNKYVMSPKDLCTIGFIDKILDAGVTVLKLEGRGRPADYVHTVTKTYRDAANAYLEGTYTPEKIESWTHDLETVFNRGFWHGGYYMGKQLGEWSGLYGSKASEEKIYLGKGLHYYEKPQIGEFTLESGELSLEDEVYIIGPTTGVLRQKVTALRVDEGDVTVAKKGQIFTMPVEKKVRSSDKLFVIKKRNTEYAKGNA